MPDRVYFVSLASVSLGKQKDVDRPFEDCTSVKIRQYRVTMRTTTPITTYRLL